MPQLLPSPKPSPSVTSPPPLRLRCYRNSKVEQILKTPSELYWQRLRLCLYVLLRQHHRLHHHLRQRFCLRPLCQLCRHPLQKCLLRYQKRCQRRCRRQCRKRCRRRCRKLILETKTVAKKVMTTVTKKSPPSTLLRQTHLPVSSAHLSSPLAMHLHVHNP